MKFKPGDKVWVLSARSLPGDRPVGVDAGVILGPCPHWDDWWDLEIEGAGAPWCAHQDYIRRRDDPPPQQEPKREATGNWDSCVWKPAREEVLT